MDRRTRVIIGFLIAPAVVPFVVFSIALAEGMRVPESAVVASIYAAFTYGAAILPGWPLFRIFARKGWTAWWQYFIGGALIGAGVLIAVSAAAQELPVQAGTLAVFVGAGVLSTLVFWMIAGKGS
jgi:hypothetical protein